MKHLYVFVAKGICLEIWGTETSLIELSDNEMRENGEERVQLLEGGYYEYLLPEGYELEEKTNIVKHSQIARNQGRITPGIYVGRLPLNVKSENGEVSEIAVEVRSTKADYRTEYRIMLEDIAKECVDLLMIHSSPVTQRYTINYEVESKTLYQRFAFVKSIVDSDDFRNAVNRIISMPVTMWKQNVEEKDIRRTRKITSSQIRQIASRGGRINLPKNHPLTNKNINSVPSKLTTYTKIDTVDTPENRFIKHALQEFRRFCGMIVQHIEKKDEKRPNIYNEAKDLEDKFGEYLNHSVFREVSILSIAPPINSPILQRKEGYRDILKVWLMYDLAAKLIWNALDEDSYNAGKRDVATLYEYWLFFKLLRLIEEIFNIESKETEKLIKSSNDELGLQLVAGKHTALSGHYTHKNRSFKVKFNYNRTFSTSKYPNSGSWTQQMRPDYTLSIWPKGFNEKEAEEQEIIVHVHFDAKYKVEDLKYLIEPSYDNDASEEKELQKQGTYKRADLLKMHAYKDAIRRTVGAYVIYPGKKAVRNEGFHEIVPGLGAFPVSPSNNGEGIDELRKFILEILDHFSNRATQREEVSYNVYEINKSKRYNGQVFEKIPEYNSIKNDFGDEFIERLAPPRKDMNVLVGYYKKEQLNWIMEKGLYNIRFNRNESDYNYKNANSLKADYLILHGEGKMETGKIFKIIESTPFLMSRKELLDRNYPSMPSQDFYLVYSVSPLVIKDFDSDKWDVRNLSKFKESKRYYPFFVTFEELMSASVK